MLLADLQFPPIGELVVWKDIGLGLNKVGRVTELPDNPQVRGMIAKVQHLVRVVEER